jgi:hypothetical protein
LGLTSYEAGLRDYANSTLAELEDQYYGVLKGLQNPYRSSDFETALIGIRQALDEILTSKGQLQQVKARVEARLNPPPPPPMVDEDTTNKPTFQSLGIPFIVIVGGLIGLYLLTKR